MTPKFTGLSKPVLYNANSPQSFFASASSLPHFFFSLQSPSIALVQIIAGDPECVSETWMSNVYSLGMVTGEAAYSACSPIQVAVGIVACGLRPEILKDCPQMLRSLMTKCWNNSPSKRPQFSEILSLLLRTRNNVR